jgi:hypothetical protein
MADDVAELWIYKTNNQKKENVSQEFVSPAHELNRHICDIKETVQWHIG